MADGQHCTQYDCLFDTAAVSVVDLRFANGTAGGAFLGLIGPGGWLIGDALNGTDAHVVEDGVAAAGGILWGNGGLGGNGIDAGLVDVAAPTAEDPDAVTRVFTPPAAVAVSEVATALPAATGPAVFGLVG